MDAKTFLYFLLTNFFRQLPEFIIVIIGIVMCFSNRAKFPKASKMALGGLLILLLTAFLSIGLALFYTYLPNWYRDSAQTIGYLSIAISFVVSVIRAAGLGLIIYAIWTERKAEAVNF